MILIKLEKLMDLQIRDFLKSYGMNKCIYIIVLNIVNIIIIYMTILIIPAAGKSYHPLFSNLSDLMIPLNGKPTIDFILESYSGILISKVIILVHESDTLSKNYLKFKSNLHNEILIQIIEVSNSKGILDTISHINLREIEEDVIINLADTIYLGDKSFKRDTLITSKHDILINSSKWCFVEQKNNQLEFYNKPKNYIGGQILIGIYYFTNISLFKQVLENQVRKNQLELYHLLFEYSQKEQFNLVEENYQWFDIGNIEHFQNSRLFFLRTRFFNSFEYDSFKGIITKKSSNTKKLLQEIHWFSNIPKELQIFTPRLTNFELNTDKPSYSLEYYGYPSLTDIFIFSQQSNEYWISIISKILNFTKYLEENHYSKKEINSSFSMLYDKTISRIEELISINPFFKSLLDKDYFIINSKKYSNFLNKKEFNGKLKSHCELISKNAKYTIVHGDLCFNNILFDVQTGIFKLIDPRGDSLYGDLRYDIAKLRHSVVGLYDLITTDLFYIEEEKENKELYEISYSLFMQKRFENNEKWFDTLIEKYSFNPNEIEFIEGLLFLSMIPLHNDNLNRQKLMFSRAIVLLSKYLS